MARFYGEIGYGIPHETAPGVWEDIMSELKYYGDVERLSRQLQEADKVNYNINVSMGISVMADEFAYEHIYAIRYVKWSGSLWTIKNVEVKRPRLIMHIGGVYNGPTPSAPSTP